MSRTRKVIVASAAANQSKRIETSAKTWGELKTQSDVASLIVGDVEAIVNPGKVTLSRDESVLPEGDFQLFLIPKKNKAGTSYSEIGDAVASAINKAMALASDDNVEDLKNELIEAVADHFNVEVEDISDVSDDELKAALAEAKSMS